MHRVVFPPGIKVEHCSSAVLHTLTPACALPWGPTGGLEKAKLQAEFLHRHQCGRKFRFGASEKRHQALKCLKKSITMYSCVFRAQTCSYSVSWCPFVPSSTLASWAIPSACDVWMRLNLHRCRKNHNPKSSKWDSMLGRNLNSLRSNLWRQTHTTSILPWVLSSRFTCNTISHTHITQLQNHYINHVRSHNQKS